MEYMKCRKVCKVTANFCKKKKIYRFGRILLGTREIIGYYHEFYRVPKIVVFFPKKEEKKLSCN